MAADGDLKWSYDFITGMMNMETPVIDECGNVYFYPENSIYLYSLNSTGVLRWKTNVGTSDALMNPVVDKNGMIYLVNENGLAKSIYSSSGTVRWTTDLNDWSSSKGAVIVDKNDMIYSLTNSILYVLYGYNGTEKYNTSLEWGDDYSQPSIDNNGVLYVGQWLGGVEAIYAVNGTQKWIYNDTIDVFNTPAISNDENTIYVGVEDHNSTDSSTGLIAIYANNGTEKWFFNATANNASAYQTYCAPTVGSDGVIYFGVTTAEIYAVYSNGTMKWNHSMVGGLSVFESNLIEHEDGNLTFVYGGDLYITTPSGVVSLLYNSPETDSRYASPSVATDGTIYFGGDGTHVYAVEYSSSAVNNYGDYVNGTVPNNYNVWRNQIHDFTPPPPIDWEVYLEDLWSSPAIAPDGCVYIGDELYPNGHMYGFYPNGTEKWNYSFYGTMASPVVDTTGEVYISDWSENGILNSQNLYAFYPNGSIKWTTFYNGTDTRIDYESNVMLDTSGFINGFGYGQNYVESFQGYFDNADPYYHYTINQGLSGGTDSSPCIGLDGTKYFTSRRGYLYARNQDGTAKWEYYYGDGGMGGNPAVSHINGDIYVVGRSGGCKFFAINSSGGLNWTFYPSSPIVDNCYSSSGISVGSDGTIYYSSRKTFYAVNSDGTEKWRYISNVYCDDGGASLTQDGSFIFVDNDAVVTSLYSGNGTLEWYMDTASTGAASSPAIAQDGSIYIAGYEYLSCLDGDSAPLYTFDDFLNGNIPNYFMNYRNQFVNTTDLVQLILSNISILSTTDNSITIGWDASENVDNVKIYRDTNTNLIGQSTGSTYSDINLAPGTKYDYWLEPWAGTTSGSKYPISGNTDSSGGGSGPDPTPQPTPQPTSYPEPDHGGGSVFMGDLHITIPDFFNSPLWIIAIFMLLSLSIVTVAAERGKKK